MSKLIIKGGKKVEDKLHAHHLGAHTQESEPPDPPETPPAKAVAPAPEPVSPEELRSAWLKLEGYHPLTEQALGEVLQAFLDGRK